MRISDWSSDVCSSDLGETGQGHGRVEQRHHRHHDQQVQQQRDAGQDAEHAVVDEEERKREQERIQHRLGAALDVFLAQARADHALLDERSEEHTSELQSLMRISYAVFCLNKKNQHTNITYKSKIKSPI